MTEFGQAKEPFFREQSGLSLAHGIPSPDTVRRRCARLDPEAFSPCFPAWVATMRRQPKGAVIRSDGKTRRHRFDPVSAHLRRAAAKARKDRLVLDPLQGDDKRKEAT